MNIIEKYEQEQIAKYTANKVIPEFKAGDSVRVNVKIVEGATERLQPFEGLVIAKRNRGLHSSFLVRKVIHGEGVERRFKVYSPLIHDITVTKRGIVRRAALYYIRGLSGKAARIKEKRAPKVQADLPKS